MQSVLKLLRPLFWLAMTSVSGWVHADLIDPGRVPIQAIVFHGNDTTRESTMLREMSIRVGDPADPARVERSRQAIQDLGLFVSVVAELRPGDGGLVLDITVVEKWYILPIPRVEANADEDYGLGLQLKWANVWGLNHRMSLFGVKRELNDRERSQETLYSFGYTAPFIANSPFEIGVSLGQSRSPVSRGGRNFNERRSSVLALVSRHYPTGAASQGWTLGGGLQWYGQNVSGADAPPRDGNSSGIVLRSFYRDVRFNVYSETGSEFGLSMAGAGAGLLSDYGYTRTVAHYSRSMHLGKRAHQTLRYGVQLGTYHGGVSHTRAFTLGGSSVMRGYDSDYREGDFVYYFVVEALRPIHWDWLRAVVILEAGNTNKELADLNLDETMVSIGLGVRMRLTWFVNLELELGISQGLTEDGKFRAFGGGV